jgi:hypothetical protein
MAALDQGTADMLLDALLGTASFTATSTPLKTMLGTSVPTATSDQTQLTGTGYTAGGTTTTWNAASSGPQNATNITVLSWTNGSGGTWSIVGIELWDATPTRKFWGTWTGQPITVANGNTFAVAAGAISITAV